jgi:3-methyladenine DNA glycosylase AlkC
MGDERKMTAVDTHTYRMLVNDYEQTTLKMIDLWSNEQNKWAKRLLEAMLHNRLEHMRDFYMDDLTFSSNDWDKIWNAFLETIRED